MIKSIVSVAFATALMGSVAFPQTHTSSTKVATQPNGMTETTPTTTESFGTVTEFTPGDSLILKTEAAEPMHYTFNAMEFSFLIFLLAFAFSGNAEVHLPTTAKARSKALEVKVQ